MSQLQNALNAWGCDVKGAMERMVNDEAFLAECLQDVAKDRNFAVLKSALDNGDIPMAFDAAHTLKGILANVGLTPMYEKVVEIVEPLRVGSNRDLSAEYAQLMEMKEHLLQILKEQ